MANEARVGRVVVRWNGVDLGAPGAVSLERPVKPTPTEALAAARIQGALTREEEEGDGWWSPHPGGPQLRVWSWYAVHTLASWVAFKYGLTLTIAGNDPSAPEPAEPLDPENRY